DVYLLNALIDVGVIYTPIRMAIPPEPSARRHHVSLLGDFLEGFRYVGKNPKVLYLVATALLLIILGQPYQQVFIPLLAIDVLGICLSGAGRTVSRSRPGGGGACVGCARSGTAR